MVGILFEVATWRLRPGMLRFVPLWTIRIPSEPPSLSFASVGSISNGLVMKLSMRISLRRVASFFADVSASRSSVLRGSYVTSVLFLTLLYIWLFCS